jgi:hypothetical protein
MKFKKLFNMATVLCVVAGTTTCFAADGKQNNDEHTRSSAAAVAHSATGTRIYNESTIKTLVELGNKLNDALKGTIPTKEEVSEIIRFKDKCYGLEHAKLSDEDKSKKTADLGIAPPKMSKAFSVELDSRLLAAQSYLNGIGMSGRIAGIENPSIVANNYIKRTIAEAVALSYIAGYDSTGKTLDEMHQAFEAQSATNTEYAQAANLFIIAHSVQQSGIFSDAASVEFTRYLATKAFAVDGNKLPGTLRRGYGAGGIFFIVKDDAKVDLKKLQFKEWLNPYNSQSYSPYYQAFGLTNACFVYEIDKGYHNCHGAYGADVTLGNGTSGELTNKKGVAHLKYMAVFFMKVK